MFGIVCLTILTFHRCLHSKSRSIVLTFRISALFATELKLFYSNTRVNLYRLTVCLLLATVYSFRYYDFTADVRMILSRGDTKWPC
mgnify:CR=1 FL=1